jgi:hypothetical protein
MPLPIRPLATLPHQSDTSNQVSTASLPQAPHNFCPTAQGLPLIPKVVRVQRHLLADDPIGDVDDSETWTFAHIIREYIDPETHLKMLRLRYVDDNEEDVYEGAVHRHMRVRPPRSQKPHKSQAS